MLHPALSTVAQLIIVVKLTKRVQDLQNKLKNCKHVTVVGNGGIVSEFVFAAKKYQMSWVIKDETITSVFVDSVASKFLLDFMKERTDNTCKSECATVSKRQIYSTVIKQKNFSMLGLGTRLSCWVSIRNGRVASASLGFPLD